MHGFYIQEHLDCCMLSVHAVQLQALKERAKQHLAAILDQQAAAGSSGNGSSSSMGSIDTRELRAKLENAIRLMQTGLVERETEVRRDQQHSSCSSSCIGRNSRGGVAAPATPAASVARVLKLESATDAAAKSVAAMVSACMCACAVVVLACVLQQQRSGMATAAEAIAYLVVMVDSSSSSSSSSNNSSNGSSLMYVHTRPEAAAAAVPLAFQLCADETAEPCMPARDMPTTGTAAYLSTVHGSLLACCCCCCCRFSAVGAAADACSDVP
jgi:hypothetical protein